MNVAEAPLRNSEHIRRLAAHLQKLVPRPIKIMEVCGGQTHSILRYGLDRLVPQTITFLHGPGCPVCVIPAETISMAIALAKRPKTVICVFGDVLRIPDSLGATLRLAQAQGGDVRLIYSPADVLRFAAEEPSNMFVFLAMGFETTAPANAMLVSQILTRNISNIRLLVAQFLIPPILELICQDESARPDAFLAPGHVCAISGTAQYEALAQKYNLPIAVTGFEPMDILRGTISAAEDFFAGRARVTLPYRRAVSREGNPLAWQEVLRFFEPAAREWRGLGQVQNGALILRKEFISKLSAAELLDADFAEIQNKTAPLPSCPSQKVLLGKLSPDECPHFAKTCTPLTPIGPAMVSPEGACAAFWEHKVCS